MKTNHRRKPSYQSLKSFILLFLRLNLRRKWAVFKQRIFMNYLPVPQHSIYEDINHKFSTTVGDCNSIGRQYNTSLIKSAGSYTYVSSSFNSTVNKQSHSYKNLLSKAVQDLRYDDDMFSYLHKELTKIKSPSICERTRPEVNLKRPTAPIVPIIQKNDYVKGRKRRMQLIKKKFLLNDDEMSENWGNNIQFIEEQGNMQECRALRQRKGGDNQLYTPMRYFNRMSFVELIRLDVFSYYKLCINQLRLVACEYCYYANLCYLIKVTSFNKYANRLALLHRIISFWRRMTVVQKKNQLNSQILYKQMNSFLLCSVRGACEITKQSLTAASPSYKPITPIISHYNLLH